MNFSALSSNDRIAAVAAVVVVITSLISLNNDWGLLMAVSLLAGLGALVVVLLPTLAPATKLPATKGVSLLALGAAATIAVVLTAVNFMQWILEHLVAIDTLQFLVGLIAAVVLLWIGWQAYQAERGTTPLAG